MQETQSTQPVSDEPFQENDSASQRSSIMEVAGRMFASVGYSRVSMSEIAQELHLSKKTLYREFEDKEDLLRAVLLPKLRASASQTEAVLSDPSIPYLEKLSRLLEIITERTSKASSVLVRDVYAHAPQVWEEITQFRKTRFECFERLISEGMEAGLLRTTVPAELVTRMYSAAMDALVNPMVLAELPYTAKQVSHAIVTMIFAGIMTDATRHEFQELC